MDRSEQAIFTNMCMIYDKDHILVQDRKKSDWSGITFPGGHVEYGESFVESVKREVFEETGLTIDSPVLCGVKQFQTSRNQRYLVLFFRTNQFTGELKSSEEGNVFWIKKEELTKYKLAPDFLDMFNIFESDRISEVYYYKDQDKLYKKIL